jgi:sugar lactone lactonase YvrE
VNKGDHIVSNVEHVLTIQDELGECPLWDSAEQALYWVDIEGNLVHRFEPATGCHETRQPGFPMTAFGFRASGGWVTAAKNGLAFWDWHSGAYEFITDPVVGQSNLRFNDGVVDRQGRFWAGTINEADFYAPDSSLFRLDPDGSVHQLDTGLATSNGLGLSPDGLTLYFVDMFHSKILAYDHDPATGAVENRRIFASVPEEAGFPDGITIDREGCVWNAHWSGWKVTRYDPDGKIEREICLPVQNVTRCAFGGAQLDVLFINTAWYGLSEAMRQNQPLAGDLFCIQTEIKGLVEPKFNG